MTNPAPCYILSIAFSYQTNLCSTALTTSYTYDQDNRVTSVTTVIKTAEGDNTFTTTVTETYTYDQYGRVSVKQTKKGAGEDASVVLTESYEYKTHPETNMPTNQLASVSVALANKTIAYSLSYDDNGNIISYDDGTYEITYVYDSANQLIRENNPRRNITYTWEYDNAGNILTYAEHAYTTESLGTAQTTKSYTYDEKNNLGGWGDLLTGYDGKSFTYDTIGNLTDDGTWAYTWEKGRQLQKMSKKDNSAEWTFTYDADGMRTARTDGTTAYTYTYNGGQLSQMTVGGKNVTFSYDASGNPQTMTYDGVTYYYITNPMGDVTGIANESGTQLVFYYYTAYGTAYVSYNTAYQALGATLSGVNPLVYRGYVYDREIGLYYLQSRYYNPKVGRFINADALVSTGQGLLGNNMFAYCMNNPVLCFDEHGTATKSCLHDSTEPSIPWRNTGSGGGIPRRDYRYKGGYVTRTEYTWFDTSNPDFLVLTNEGLKFASWGLSVFDGTYCFDDSEEEYLYLSVGNIEAYAGAHIEDGFGVSASAGLIDIGYHSNAIDLSVSVLSIGGGYIIKNGKVKAKINAGLIGGSVALDILEFLNWLLEE